MEGKNELGKKISPFFRLKKCGSFTRCANQSLPGLSDKERPATKPHFKEGEDARTNSEGGDQDEGN